MLLQVLLYVLLPGIGEILSDPVRRMQYVRELQLHPKGPTMRLTEEWVVEAFKDLHDMKRVKALEAAQKTAALQATVAKANAQAALEIMAASSSFRGIQGLGFVAAPAATSFASVASASSRKSPWDSKPVQGMQAASASFGSTREATLDMVGKRRQEDDASDRKKQRMTNKGARSFPFSPELARRYPDDCLPGGSVEG